MTQYGASDTVQSSATSIENSEKHDLVRFVKSAGSVARGAKKTCKPKTTIKAFVGQGPCPNMQASDRARHLMRG